MTDVRNQTRESLVSQFESWQLPMYRVDQLLQWLYPRRAQSWDAMTNLPLPLRTRLAQAFTINTLDLVSKQGAQDTTRKFLWRLPDAALIESVLIPANPALYGERSDRHTLCVSTQVGCAYGCRFCASGLDGWKRNLEPWEILGQILAVEQWYQTDADFAQPITSNPAPTNNGIAPDRLVSNLVIMGMGEPMANYDALLVALRILNAPWGGGIGARKITISTSGVVPGILRLANEPEQFRLAISLHGARDEVRSKIMPVNRRYPLQQLTDACTQYVAKKGRMITLEYILISGINDALDEIEPLSRLARRLHAKVNLIPYNRVEGLTWERPTDVQCRAFAKALESTGITSTLRLEKGHDIDAACGQLRLRTERQQPST